MSPLCSRVPSASVPPASTAPDLRSAANALLRTLPDLGRGAVSPGGHLRAAGRVSRRPEPGSLVGLCRRDPQGPGEPGSLSSTSLWASASTVTHPPSQPRPQRACPWGGCSASQAASRHTARSLSFRHRAADLSSPVSSWHGLRRSHHHRVLAPHRPLRMWGVCECVWVCVSVCVCTHTCACTVPDLEECHRVTRVPVT